MCSRTISPISLTPFRNLHQSASLVKIIDESFLNQTVDDCIVVEPGRSDIGFALHANTVWIAVGSTLRHSFQIPRTRIRKSLRHRLSEDIFGITLTANSLRVLITATPCAYSF